MQALNQRVNSNCKNKIFVNNNSKGDISHNFGNFDLSKVDYNINFDFKYVTGAELQAIVKRVKRTRQKKQDEEKWQSFLRLKQSKDADDSSDDGVCEHCIVGEVNCSTECLQPQDLCKDMPKVEENEIQGNLINPVTTFGANIDENISHAYQLGGVLIKRLQDLVATVGRMTSLLLSSVSTRSAQYEDEDVDRAIKRSVEFDAMFARNHLYEIQRLLKDTKQLAAGKSPRGELETKISAALKCVSQALQVYAKHVCKGARVKYQQVVPIFQSISTIHCLLEQLTGQRAFPFRQDLEVSCSYMKQLLLEMSTTDTQSVATVSRKSAKLKPAARHKPSADLSMYSRRRTDWRRKSVSLARAKFGPPGKKHKIKSEYISERRKVEESKDDFNENDSFQARIKVTDKCPVPARSNKEPVNAKEVPYRNATRAVPEEDVTTMMEMIPNEPIEDGGLTLDDCTFQALIRLNGTHAPLQQETVFKSQQSPAISKSASAPSDKGEPTNVQLICLREEEIPKSNSFETDILAVNSDTKGNSPTTLTVEEQAKSEALEYRHKMVEYHKTNSHYKDGKALGIVDRLATRILTEMVMDFQKEEMNNVIETLYNLEFQ